MSDNAVVVVEVAGEAEADLAVVLAGSGCGGDQFVDFGALLVCNHVGGVGGIDGVVVIAHALADELGFEQQVVPVRRDDVVELALFWLEAGLVF